MAQNIYPVSGQYEDYLTDESRYCGTAESISFPESEEEAACMLKELSLKKIPAVIQGAKTGIAGGAVPDGGHILNLSRMNRVLDAWTDADGTGRIRVQPGISLLELRKEIGARFRKNPQFWPVEPTETSASIGGIAAAGAQGISRVLYGKSAQYFESVHVMDENGQITKLCRGESRQLLDGQQVDALDLALGREGITGVLTQLTLKLLPKPEAVWGIAFFFDEDMQAAGFIERLKEELPKRDAAAVAAVEYIGRTSLWMIAEKKADITAIKELPDIAPAVAAMVYTEIHGQEESIEEIAEQLMELAAEYGSDPEQAWAVSGEAEVEKLRVFRHAAAETANLFIAGQHRKDRRITKLGMDMFCSGTFGHTLDWYQKELAASGLKGCIFGHALENHLHVNILPQSYEEYCQGIRLMREWAFQIGSAQGTLIGEHGIGKLKREIFGEQLFDAYIGQCKKIKELFDVSMINRDNIWKEQ